MEKISPETTQSKILKSVILSYFFLSLSQNHTWTFTILLATLMVQLVVIEINDANWTGLGSCLRSYSHAHNALTNCCSSRASCGAKPFLDVLHPQQTWARTCFHARLICWRLAKSVFHHWPYRDGSHCPRWPSPVAILRSLFCHSPAEVCSLWRSVSSVKIRYMLIERDIRWCLSAGW